jgi:tyrosyl-tRNA synthetase
MTLSEILQARGFVNQFSSETLAEITDGEKRALYLGVDPTAESIHVGNLAGYMLLRHFAEAGHKVVLLIGGGTGMIGDPKPDVERPLTPPEVVAARADKLTSQARQLLGGVELEVVNNADWLAPLSLIDFLRDIGKHFTVNALIKKDAISARLGSEEGISYTEFAYPLLQAYDFWHLFREKGVTVQVGGSDQWGNITAGVELIRRKEGKMVYALTLPIIVDKSTGKKFGKSEGNAVWLDPKMTTPFEFYQFWLNASDESVEDYLKIFTLLSLEDIASVVHEQRENPGARAAQKKLALEATAIVHGRGEAEAARDASDVLFGVAELTPETAHALRTGAPMQKVAEGDALADVLVLSSLASSKREARQFLDDGAVLLAGAKTDGGRLIGSGDFLEGVAILKRGKKHAVVLVLQK